MLGAACRRVTRVGVRWPEEAPALTDAFLFDPAHSAGWAGWRRVWRTLGIALLRTASSWAMST